MRLRLVSDERGIAAVEFALVATPLLVIIMGGCDLGHTLFMQSVLHGTVQKAARDSSLATGTEVDRQAAIDAKVRSSVRMLYTGLKDDDIKIDRLSYRNFTTAQAAQPEDANQNGVCEAGETWIDRNFNDVYDAKGGATGQGGAKDVVVYSVSVSYPRLFPMARLVGLPRNVTLRARAVLANQPYGEQVAKTGSLTPRTCA